MSELTNRYYYYRVGRAVKRATRSDFANGYLPFPVRDRSIQTLADGDEYLPSYRRIVRRKVKVVIATSWAEAVDFIKRTNA